MKKLNKIIIASLLVAMALPSMTFAAGKLPNTASNVPVSIKIDGNYKNPTADLGLAYVDVNTNRTMVPIRFISNELGLNIKYLLKSEENPQGGIAISAKDNIITMNTNSKTATVVKGSDKKTVELDSPSIIYDDRTYVPVRFISEALGYNVDWSNNTVSIIRDKKVADVNTPSNPVPAVKKETDTQNINEKTPYANVLDRGPEYGYIARQYGLTWFKNGDVMELNNMNKEVVARESVSEWIKYWGMLGTPDEWGVAITFRGTNREFKKRYNIDKLLYYNDIDKYTDEENNHVKWFDGTIGPRMDTDIQEKEIEI